MGLNLCAIVIRYYAVMAVSRNGFSCLRKWCWAPIKFTYYADMDFIEHS
jgi:hypothetical protein